MSEKNEKIAIVFPGQGSQSLGMLKAIAEENPLIIETFAQASAVLGYDLWALTQEGPIAQLNQTEFTQPAVLAADVALYRVWQARHPGFLPIVLAGHSLGEFAALVCAESLDFQEAITLVAKRGRWMQAAVPEGLGAMAAIVGLEDSVVREICLEAAEEEVLAPANFNSIGQVVIAGHANAVERALPIAKARGAKIAKRIPVSVPSHCPLMQTVATHLAEALTHISLKSPSISVLHNVDVCAYHQPKEIANALVAQLTHPVRWVETIQAMEAMGATSIVECGPGQVLVGLNKRITQNVQIRSIF